MSARLKQDGQVLGLREFLALVRAIGSPQQMQIIGFIDELVLSELVIFHRGCSGWQFMPVHGTCVNHPIV